MSSVVPFIAKELADPQNAAMALNFFGEAGKAAAGMYKAHKAKRKRTGKRPPKFPVPDFGHSAKKAEYRRNDRQLAITGTANKTLYSQPVISVEKNVAADEAINKRARDAILHKGSKICFTVKSVIESTVYFNWAVVIPKANNTVSPSNFLRGNGTERDVTVDNSLSSLDIKCLPINTDLYHVLTMRRLTIKPDSNKNTTEPLQGEDFRFIEKYLKTNRKLYFDGSNAAPLQNMHMVWWCDNYGSNTGTTGVPVYIEWKIIDYFEDLN